MYLFFTPNQVATKLKKIDKLGRAEKACSGKAVELYILTMLGLGELTTFLIILKFDWCYCTFQCG